MRANIKGISMVWLSRTGLTNLNSGEGGSNLVDIKKYRWLGQDYPYVSGQAMRYYLREAIRRQLGPNEACLADDKGETCGQVKTCVTCDLFGFMSTLPDVGAVTRVSPLKVSPAMGLLPLKDNAVVDFLTRRHRLQAEGEMKGDIVNVELSTNVYQAGLSLDLIRLGAEEKPVSIGEIAGGKKDKKEIFGFQIEPLVSPQEKDRRLRLLIEAVMSFSDYSKQARLLTDFTPDVLLVAAQPKYSHRLQKALLLEADGSPEMGVGLNVQRLTEVLEEVTSEGARVFGGMISGVLSNQDEVKGALEQFDIKVGTPRDAAQSLIQFLGV